MEFFFCFRLTYNFKQKQKNMKATYVSVWDSGIEIRTACEINLDTKDVTDVESVEVDGLDTLNEQFVELPNGDKITEFTLDGEEI